MVYFKNLDDKLKVFKTKIYRIKKTSIIKTEAFLSKKKMVPRIRNLVNWA